MDIGQTSCVAQSRLHSILPRNFWRTANTIGKILSPSALQSKPYYLSSWAKQRLNVPHRIHPYEKDIIQESLAIPAYGIVHKHGNSLQNTCNHVSKPQPHCTPHSKVPHLCGECLSAATKRSSLWLEIHGIQLRKSKSQLGPILHLVPMDNFQIVPS